MERLLLPPKPSRAARLAGSGSGRRCSAPARPGLSQQAGRQAGRGRKPQQQQQPSSSSSSFSRLGRALPLQLHPPGCRRPPCSGMKEEGPGSRSLPPSSPRRESALRPGAPSLRSPLGHFAPGKGKGERRPVQAETGRGEQPVSMNLNGDDEGASRKNKLEFILHLSQGALSNLMSLNACASVCNGAPTL
ncbi:uncharacterized protein LOC143824001 [Paroedura picta]|uniref:uncharacterized protein LOC143824001 n=1 Tax=Paroedura picta TaxID=143630 RepID=UPI004057BC57